METFYLYGNDLISQQQGTEEFFYLEDGHSGVRQLVDENGMVTDSYSYDAYGNLLGSTRTSENDYLYRGEQFDESLDLQYLRARYYDPTTGRFISTDPFEGNIEQPVSRHRYLYGNANPVTFSDPSGLIASVAELGARNAIELNLQTRVFTTLAILGNTLSDRFHKPIRWDGVIGGGTASIPSGPPEFSFSPIGAVSNLELTSECVVESPLSAFTSSSFGQIGQKLEGGVWTLVGGGAALGELYFGVAGGPITAFSPRKFGLNPYVFTPAFASGAFNLVGGVFNLEGLAIGKGWATNPFKPGAAYLTANSLSIIAGFSFYWGGSGKFKTCMTVPQEK